MVTIADPLLSDEILENEKAGVLPIAADEIDRLYHRAQQCRQKLMAIPRGMKPKQYRRLLWDLNRLVVKTSRQVRLIKFQRCVLRQFIDHIRAAVEELKPLGDKIATREAAARRLARSTATTASKTCGRSSARTTSGCSNWKRSSAPRRPSCGARCRSSSAPTRKPRAPRRS